MRVIQKQLLAPVTGTAGEVGVILPVDAEIGHVHEQQGLIGLRYVCDPDPEAEVETRHFWVVGTGHEFKDAMIYHGSVHIEPWVWHVLEVPS